MNPFLISVHYCFSKYLLHFILVNSLFRINLRVEGKEADEVLILFVKATDTIKNGGDITALVPDLVTAVNGVDAVDDEYRENRGAVMATIGYRMGELTDVLLKKKKAEEPEGEDTPVV